MLPDEFRQLVAAIRNDHTSGAEDIALQAASALTKLAEGGPSDSQVIEACQELMMAQPAMAPLVNLANMVLWDLEHGEGLRATCNSFVQSLEAARFNVCQNAAEMLQDGITVMTHSSSRTVLEALTFAAQAPRDLRVICTESRPAGEGVNLARSLGEVGVEVTLVTDASMFQMMDQADLALSGADAITARGVVNKTGTTLLALAAKECGRDFCVLCGTQKFIPAGYQLPPEPLKPPEEVLREPPPAVLVENRYFETTPLHLVSGVVTENGILGPKEMRRLVERGVHPALLSGSRR